MNLTLFTTSLNVWKVITSTFKECSRENRLFSLSLHYTEQISPLESTALVSKNGDCVRVGFLTEGQVGDGRCPDMAG